MLVVRSRITRVRGLVICTRIRIRRLSASPSVSFFFPRLSSLFPFCYRVLLVYWVCLFTSYELRYVDHVSALEQDETVNQTVGSRRKRIGIVVLQNSDTGSSVFLRGFFSPSYLFQSPSFLCCLAQRGNLARIRSSAIQTHTSAV